MNFIFNDNVRILCLSCNVKKVGKLVRFKQKGPKQASFLAFHKCCQGCLLRGPRYISTSFILVFALRCYIATGYQESLFVGWKVYSQKFIRIAYLYSKCTDCRINNIIWSSLSVTCGILVFSQDTQVSSTNKNWLPPFSWNIVESGIKHHNPNHKTLK